MRGGSCRKDLLKLPEWAKMLLSSCSSPARSVAEGSLDIVGDKNGPRVRQELPKGVLHATTHTQNIHIDTSR